MDGLNDFGSRTVFYLAVQVVNAGSGKTNDSPGRLGQIRLPQSDCSLPDE